MYKILRILDDWTGLKRDTPSSLAQVCSMPIPKQFFTIPSLIPLKYAVISDTHFACAVTARPCFCAKETTSGVSPLPVIDSLFWTSCSAGKAKGKSIQRFLKKVRYIYSINNMYMYNYIYIIILHSFSKHWKALDDVLELILRVSFDIQPP